MRPTEMTHKTASRAVTVVNSQGMHARPVNLFVQLASQFESKIDVIRGDERVDGKSILSILTLAAAQGTELSIEATGQDADAALDALADLVAKGFAEEEVNP